MRDARNSNKVPVTESTEYLRGYRDGLRDRQAAFRHHAGDGLLGALIAIFLILGIGYLGYNYANTGHVLPSNLDLSVKKLLPKPSGS
jgi:hypothetical protein